VALLLRDAEGVAEETGGDAGRVDARVDDGLLRGGGHELAGRQVVLAVLRGGGPHDGDVAHGLT
jgi:hypothetical protein